MNHKSGHIGGNTCRTLQYLMPLYVVVIIKEKCRPEHYYVGVYYFATSAYSIVKPNSFIEKVKFGLIMHIAHTVASKIQK